MDQPPSSAAPIFDVSKDRLDVSLRPSGEAFTVPRDGEGLERLTATLSALGPALVVLEATGGFEITVAAALAAAGLPLAVVNQRQIRVVSQFEYTDCGVIHPLVEGSGASASGRPSRLGSAAATKRNTDTVRRHSSSGAPARRAVLEGSISRLLRSAGELSADGVV